MPTSFKDYYATLGVARDASPEEIKKAFRRLARTHHPDVAKDKSTAGAKFQEINEAYEVLSDPGKRAKYDQLSTRQAAPERGAWSFTAAQDEDFGQEFHFGGTGFSDFFERYFSGGRFYGFPPGTPDGPTDRARQGRDASRGQDIEGDILVTLEEAMHGTVRSLSLQMLNRETGQVETRTFRVRIPPGAIDGRRIRVPEKGEAGHQGGPAGDLYLRVRHAAHPDFTSRDADLYHELDLAPWEAVLGAEVVVPTLDGSVKLRIPPGAEHGQKMRLRGLGLPKGKTGEQGDLFVILNLVLPTSLNSEERAAWEKLRDVSTFRPRPVATHPSTTP